MVNLPIEFENRMKEMLGDEFDSYLASFDRKSYSGIRLNTLKTNKESFLSQTDFTLNEVPWINNAFFYGEEDVPSKHPYYYAGLYYIQEPSAMTPAFLFDVMPGHKVLDVCAAPGGKSTALAAKLCGEGVLVSNDVSNSRAKALLKNIELFGVKNPIVVSESTDKLAKKFAGYFDRILVDAPCSGEGMFRKQPAIMKNWEQYGTSYYADLQKMILPDAIKMLKPGGKLLYSTCTFSPEEDEKIVEKILNDFPEMSIGDLIPEDKRNKFAEIGFSFGRPEWSDSKNPDLRKTIRLFPHKINGEGHFIALFEKSADCFCEMAPIKYIKKPKLSDEFLEFITHLNFDIDLNRVIIKDERYYYMPEDIPDLSGLRILRSGLLLGEQKKNRFEPSQALACSLKIEDFDNVYNISSSSDDCIKYLKCESIDINADVKDGYVLVCCDGYSLGFGKVKGNSFKNKYLPGWRLM